MIPLVPQNLMCLFEIGVSVCHLASADAEICHHLHDHDVQQDAQTGLEARAERLDGLDTWAVFASRPGRDDEMVI